ncbi:opacity protein-like surface antigen [Pseudoduganella flava]|uniref:Opacity protein-like surface antigen n=1 Tax=Pseudoduganella flava TaxID=871742 RepID=A0A562PN39_9BURK|nr:outer membrane beta-barrel protein [Pseudoduganella flava]QGZ40444.1 outer membrane beta-barrel protein [Pseudoduganella flava]TWI45882.1 opacity protein-like surface antigen [Pseudoduganella flava]
MKHRISMAMLAVGTLALHAAGAEPTRYWGVHAGANTLKDWDARVDFGAGTPFDGRADLKRGVHGGVQVGHADGHGRYELEYERGSLRFERLTLGPISEAVDGRGHYDAVFANAYRTDSFGNGFGTFAGGGIGWGRVKLPQLGLASTDCPCFGPASKSGFAWQLRAGVEYRPAPQYAFSLQYTWLGLPAPERNSSPSIDYDKRRFGALSLGYSRRF